MITGNRLWLGLAVSLIFLALLFHNVDLGKLSDALRGANYLFVIPALAVYLLSLWFRTFRWQYLLKGTKPIPQTRLYPIVVMGYMANNLLPIRLGELVRAYLVGEREGVSKTTALATILLERLSDGLVLILLAFLISPFLPVGRPLAELGRVLDAPSLLIPLLVISPFLIVLGALVVIATYPRLVNKLGAMILRLVPQRHSARARRLGGTFVAGLQVLRSPNRALVALSLSAPIWLAEATMYHLIAYSFSLNLPFTVALFITSAANLAIIVPSTGGGIGPFEWATKVSLVALGVDSAVATAYAIALHAALLIPVTLLGLFILWLQNLSLRELTKKPAVAWQEPSGVSPTPSQSEGRL